MFHYIGGIYSFHYIYLFIFVSEKILCFKKGTDLQMKKFLFLLIPLFILSSCSKGEERDSKSGERDCKLDVSTLPSPSPEPVEVYELPKPSEVLGWGAPKFTPDGKKVSFVFAPSADINRRHIGVINEEGSGFQCLTCDLPINAGPHIWFPDGNRILFYFFKLVEPNFFVFELSNHTTFYEIKNISTPGELTHDRFPVLSPDGRKLVWTKVRMDGFHSIRIS
jgi:hypothetical protein